MNEQERKQRMYDHGGDECDECGREDSANQMYNLGGKVFCQSCASVEDLAREFSRLLRRDLSARQMAEVVRLNDTEANKSVCHTHDFCDANMVMAEAFRNCGLPDAVTTNDDSTDLWNAAWDQAKADRFQGKML